MSLNKAIEHNKEHRKIYRGAKAVDPACRNHGSDPWDKSNRTYKNKKRLEKALDKEKDMYYNNNIKKGDV